MYQYPVIYRRSEGEIKVRFPDIPEIITSGDTLPQAKALAYDALICALGGYMHLKRPVPGASKPAKACICLSALHSAKLALYSCMLEHRISQVALADRLGVTEGPCVACLTWTMPLKSTRLNRHWAYLAKE